MGGGGSNNREAPAIPTKEPFEPIFIDNPNDFFNQVPYKSNIAIIILIIFVLLFHLYIKSRIKY
jgi:hypothetical protein